MKQKAKIENMNLGIAKKSPTTAFELMMNFQCDMRAEVGLEPLLHWEQVRQTPEWVKNICRNLRKTVLKSILKLRPKRKVNWRNYGRLIGIMERYKTFLAKDLPQILKEESFNRISDKKWDKIQPLLGEEEARQYYLKILERPANDGASLLELTELVLEKQLVRLEKSKETAFLHLSNQGAKTVKIFLKGMSEGYTAFMDEEGQFSGDDRRADIYLELLAWQYDIEKMRKSVLPKTSNHLIEELKKNPEFKNKTHDWFKDVFKDIKLSIGRRGRPWKFSCP
jgi:hypothetical protein